GTVVGYRPARRPREGARAVAPRAGERVLAVQAVGRRGELVPGGEAGWSLGGVGVASAMDERQEPGPVRAPQRAVVKSSDTRAEEGVRWTIGDDAPSVTG